MAPRLLPAALGALVLLGGAALACPVCYDAGSPAVAETYQRSTMMLSLLPFGIVGGIGGAAAYLARRSRPADDAGGSPITTR
jgi:hypothetical protein